MVAGQAKALTHSNGITIIVFPEQRHLWLGMALKTRLTGTYQFPLGPVWTVD